MNRKLIPLTSPGEILKEEFIQPLGLKQKDVAESLEIPESRLSEIISGKRIITADSAIRFSRYFRTTPEFWLNLQNHYDLQKTRELNKESLLRIRPIRIKKTTQV